MQTRAYLIGTILLFGTATSASAQFIEGDPQGTPMGESRLQRMQVGITVSATRGACNGVTCYTAVPIEWPEQQVKIVDEEITPNARVRYVSVGETAKMMEVRVATLRPGEEAKAIVTFEIRRSMQLPPDEADTNAYVIPDSKSMGRDVRIFLAPSPKIESRDRKIRALANEIGADREKAWDRVEAIYDWVRDNVEYKNGPLKGALAALNSGTGDCEELTSLFIAICRAADIPARTVWVQGHCYPEFYLADADDKGHWFPCQAAGTRAFGGIPEFRPVLSKGDSFRPPYDRREIQRYPADHCFGSGGQPRVKFTRKMEAG
ncbi:MAG: transglutaminase-like domain-containing protein [Thermoguttaceae bacterium]